MTETAAAAPLTRSARKRQTILAASRALFLSNGYQGTSVDQIAASAEVSKQTVYKHFGDKQELLVAIVTDALDNTVGAIQERIAALAHSTDLETDLIALADNYLRAVLQEPVVQLRRLVVGEANRLPALAKLYYDHAPGRTLAAFADCFRRLHDLGHLHSPEPALAAEHFAFLIVGRPIDQALFCGGPAVLAGIDPAPYVRAGVEAFLAAYRPRPATG
jgi:TetR/AcrR family transcriptional repressor of mexJK operon